MPALSQAATSGSSIAIASPAPPQRGDRPAFTWAADAPDARNRIGVYPADRLPGSGGSSLVWTYVPGASGQTTLDTSGLSGGPYIAYLPRTATASSPRRSRSASPAPPSATRSS
ncbi:hypothetical protein ABZ876_21150 [Streptomyces sp. NPDC046931]|uniref:hypothetical protein n=1 Tax=Streptomyces sp. NPDC046931 TaxID=3154806 RepID=UPI0033F0576E